jgi:glycyl-tRNA synthetase beta subunit
MSQHPHVSDFLLEIGSEEIPHWMIPSAMKQLAEKLDLFGAIPTVDATPRRLVTPPRRSCLRCA